MAALALQNLGPMLFDTTILLLFVFTQDLGLSLVTKVILPVYILREVSRSVAVVASLDVEIVPLQ